MTLGPHLVTRAALDPFGFFILVIILFNVVSTVIAGLKRAGAKAAAKADDTQAQTQRAQALKSSPVAASQSAARAAQLERIRRALLAAAGTPDQSAGAVQTASYTATTQPATAAVRYRAPTPAPTAPAPQAPMPPAPVAASAPVFDMGPGFATPALMTLESGTTAFDRLATATGARGAGQPDAVAAKAPAGFDLLQMPNSGAYLFIAAAIVGPCAAFRPIGHTPGGW